MTIKLHFSNLLFFVAFGFFSCASDDNYVPIEPEPVSPVVLDIPELPYDRLSTYHFFDGPMKDQNPVYGVLPYLPISTLFTDYAKKKRFVWMPQGVKADFVEAGQVLDFPVGTVLIKNFYYDNVLPSNQTKIIETRLMVKTEPSTDFNSGWKFYEYVWNEDQTEAYLDMQGSFLDVSWMTDEGLTKSTSYRIPSEGECFVCHKTDDKPTPIGVKPQNINSTYTFATGAQNQLTQWVNQGYLNAGFDTAFETVVNYQDASQSLGLRVRSYLDINCAHCHSRDTHCDYTPMRLAFSDTSVLTNLGVCVTPIEESFDDMPYIITPSQAMSSIMHYRMNATEEAVRMPLLGRTLVHEEGVQLLEQWINTLTNPCP